MSQELLVWPFPMPDDDLIREAYWNLHLSEEGTDAQKKRLGDASRLPRPWDIATCTEPELRAVVWQWYADFVTWFNHEYVWDPAAGMIPACWHLHPHLVHEIGALADRRRDIGTSISSGPLEEWHRYAVPDFLDRLRERVKQHCDEGHQPWPARTRFKRHLGEESTTEHDEAIDADLAQHDPDHQPAVGRHLRAVETPQSWSDPLPW